MEVEKELNPNQKIFVEEYLSNNFNTIKAYMVAYPKCEAASLSGCAYRLKGQPHIQKEINKRLEERIGTKEELANKVLDKLSEMAFAEKTDEIYTPAVVQKAIDLIQKQLSLQTQKVEANVSTSIVINILDEDDDSE